MERAFRSNRALVEIASASRSLHSAFAANSVSFPTSQRLPLHKRSTRNAIAPFRQSRRTPVPPRNPRALAAPSRHAHLAMPSRLSVSRAELRFHLESPERLQLQTATPTSQCHPAFPSVAQNSGSTSKAQSACMLQTRHAQSQCHRVFPSVAQNSGSTSKAQSACSSKPPRPPSAP
jgi:hypothetical protein